MKEVSLATATKRTWLDEVPTAVRELLVECVSEKVAALEYSKGWAMTLKGDAKYEKFNALKQKQEVLEESRNLLRGSRG